MKTFFSISLVFSCLATKTDLNPTQNVKNFFDLKNEFSIRVRDDKKNGENGKNLP